MNYNYYYYFPDLDQTSNRRSHKRNSFIPNTIDMRESFKEIGIPECTFFYKSFWNYRDEIEFSVYLLKNMIDELFSSHTINNWQELSVLLKEYATTYRAQKYCKEKKN